MTPEFLKGLADNSGMLLNMIGVKDLKVEDRAPAVLDSIPRDPRFQVHKVTAIVQGQAVAVLIVSQKA